MHIIVKHYDLGIFIAAVNIFVYFIAMTNIIATLVFKYTTETQNQELSSDPRDEVYLTFYKTILLFFALIMIIASVNLLRGIIKKTPFLIISWLAMSLCALGCQALFLLDQIVYYQAYGYTAYNPLVLVGLYMIFGLQIFCISKIWKFTLDLYKDNIIQTEEISILKNSACKRQNYADNVAHNDSSLLAPLNEKQLKEPYSKCNSLNLNKFTI